MLSQINLQGEGKGNAGPSKTKRRGVTRQLKDALSETPSVASAPKKASKENGGFNSVEEQIHYLVNLALDGNDEPLNAVDNKVVRGKAKAMIVKIKRGSLDRPTMPSTPTKPVVSDIKDSETKLEEPDLSVSKDEDEQGLIDRLVEAGVGGNMDEINALENRVLRGKIKAAIVKKKREQK
jgi:hypothetical protein